MTCFQAKSRAREGACSKVIERFLTSTRLAIHRIVCRSEDANEESKQLKPALKRRRKQILPRQRFVALPAIPRKTSLSRATAGAALLSSVASVQARAPDAKTGHDARPEDEDEPEVELSRFWHTYQA